MNLEVKDKKTGEVHKVGFADSKLPLNEWIAKHDTWDESTLVERQKWWIKSLQKTWPIPTTSFQPTEEDTSIYLLDTTDLKGRTVRSVEIFGEVTSVTTWSETLDTITEAIYNRNQDFIEKVIDDEYLSKWIRQDSSSFHNSVEILDTGYYVDTGTDTNTKLRLIAALGKEFNLATNDIRAELTAKKNTDEEEL